MARLTLREKRLAYVLAAVFAFAVGYHTAAALNPAVGANGIDWTRTNTDVCPSGSHTCTRANSNGEPINKINGLTTYIVNASPSPSPGQSLTYNANGIWTPGTGGGMSINGSITGASANVCLFSNASSQLGQDPSSCLYDSTNHTLTLKVNDATSTIPNLVLDNVNGSAYLSSIQYKVGGTTVGNVYGANADVLNGPMKGWNVDVSTGNSFAINVNASRIAWWNSNGLNLQSGKTIAGYTASGVLTWSPADDGTTFTPALQAGSFTIGNSFRLAAAGTVSGVRFYYPGPTSFTIKGSVWDNSHTRQGSCTVAVSTAGIYTCTFTPVSVPARTTYYVSYWENSGTDYWVSTMTAGATPAWNGASQQSVAVAGPYIVFGYPNGVVYQASAGDAYPSATNAGSEANVEPIFTVP